MNTLCCRPRTLHSRSIIPFSHRRTARRSTNQRSISGGEKSPLQPSDGSWMIWAVQPSAFGSWRANHGRSDTVAVIQDALASCLYMSHSRHIIYHVSSYHTHCRHVIIWMYLVSRIAGYSMSNFHIPVNPRIHRTGEPRPVAGRLTSTHRVDTRGHRLLYI